MPFLNAFAVLLVFLCFELNKKHFELLIIEWGKLHDVLESGIQVIFDLFILFPAINYEIIQPKL